MSEPERNTRLERPFDFLSSCNATSRNGELLKLLALLSWPLIPTPVPTAEQLA